MYKKKQWSEIVTIVNGKNQKDVADDSGSYPIYGSGGIIGYATDYLCEAGTTIIGRKGTINSPIYVKEPFWNIDTAFGIVPGDSILPLFLYYFCLYYDFAKLDKSTTLPSLAKKDLLKIDMPVPELDEQENIVSRIEGMFSELDKAEEILQETKSELEIYRQAVLKEAFEGIDKTILMKEVATMIDPQPSHRTPPEVQDGIPYVGVADFNYQNNTINFKDARKVSNAVLDDHRGRYQLESGDFVMGKIGTIGKPFRISLPQNYALSANIILIKPDRKKITPQYLFWQFSSPYIKKQLDEGANATSQPAFGIKKARTLLIKICSLDQQHKIVNMIEAKMSVCDNIESALNLTIAQTTSIRQSILKHAFEGGFK